MISQHTLAREMVTREKNEVFDDRCLDLIERFISDPSRKDAMMNEYGWCDEEGQKPGEKAASMGDLVGLCVARHGTEHYVFKESDLAMLREWYASGKQVMESKL